MLEMQQSAAQAPDGGRSAFMHALARSALAVAITATLGLLWWRHLPTALHSTSDIVGYAAFRDFNYSRSIPMYRFVVYGIPVLTVSLYAVLGWRGPLRTTRIARERHRSILLIDTAQDSVEVAPRGWPTSVACLLTPALVLTIEASTRSTAYAQRVSTGGLISGGLYLLLVAAAAAAVTVYRRRDAAHQIRFSSALSLVNGLAGSSAAVLGLWFVSRHTVIKVTSDSTAKRQSWLPIELALLVVAAIGCWVAWRRIRRDSASEIEYRLLTVVVGSVFVFLLYALLPGALGAFSGFDDAQDLAGANLLAKGAFPWRDLLFIHGLYLDVLRGSIDFGLFGNSRWGAASGDAVILSPLGWVVEYLFVVWVARRNGWFILGFVSLLAAGIFDTVDTRFMLVPLTFVLVGETIRRRKSSWAVLLTSVLFAQAILVPETALLAVPSLLTVALACWVHRQPGDSWSHAWRPAIACAFSGFLMSAAFLAFLVLNRSLNAFVDYYRIFAPGHVPSGAIPPIGITSKYYFEFGLIVATVVLTFWSIAWRLGLRRDWTPQQWTAVAGAGFLATYGEKALGRFDVGHVGEVFAVGLPLVVLWAKALLTAAERYWPGEVVLSKVTSLKFKSPLTAAACVLLLVHFQSIPNSVQKIPGRLHAVAPTEPSIANLGYAQPDAVDPELISDLRVALNHYAGPAGSVFDMTNSLGYVYYLLQKTPGTRFDNISMAVPEVAQKLLISELKRSRPPVIIFNSTSIGLPNWDGVANNVRHYEVSQYVLDGWAPVLETHGELLLLRKDLLAQRPSVPKLSTTPETAGLWFDSQECDWGYIPNFLTSKASGASLRLPVSAAGTARILSLTGWAADPATKSPASDLIITDDHQEIDSVTQGKISRPDVSAAVSPRAAFSGFATRAAIADNATPSVFEKGSDGLLHQLRVKASDKPLTGSVRLSSGLKIKIGGPGLGSVDSHTETVQSVAEVNVPPGVDLGNYALATLAAATSLNRTSVAISDSILSPTHQITAETLPSSGASLGVRVGSCIQWRGYAGGKLYVMQSGGPAITSLTLSGVQG